MLSSQYKKDRTLLEVPDVQYCLRHKNISHLAISFRSGVSNTRPAGRMWPARYIYAADKHLKK